MPQVNLVPDAVIANNGWANPENIFTTNNIHTTYSEVVEGNTLKFSLSNLGSGISLINSIRVGLNRLFITSKTSTTGYINVQILRGSEDEIYYSEDVVFNQNALNYLQTTRSEVTSGVKWTQSLVNGIQIQIRVNNEETTTFPINLDQVYLVVDYSTGEGPIELTSGFIELTSGKIII